MCPCHGAFYFTLPPLQSSLHRPFIFGFPLRSGIRFPISINCPSALSSAVSSVSFHSTAPGNMFQAAGQGGASTWLASDVGAERIADSRMV